MDVFESFMSGGIDFVLSLYLYVKISVLKLNCACCVAFSGENVDFFLAVTIAFVLFATLPSQ